MQSTLDTIIKYDILSKRQIKVFYSLLKYEDFQKNIYSNSTSYDFLEIKEGKNLKSEFVYQTMLDVDKMLIDYVEKLYKTKVVARVGRSILKYTNDKFIKLHRDIEANTERPVQVSSVLYINDNYLGGEIFFLDSKKNKILELKPQAGSVIFFDSTHFHGTNPIVSGVKYCYNSLYCF